MSRVPWNLGRRCHGGFPETLIGVDLRKVAGCGRPLAAAQWEREQGRWKVQDTPCQGHCTLSTAQKAKPETQTVLEPTLATILSRA